MKHLLEMPTERFPLNWTKYNRLMDELQDAAEGFADLERDGWPHANEIDIRLMEVRHCLWQTWNLIMESERELRAKYEAATVLPTHES